MRPGLAAAPRALRARDERDALRIAVYCPHYQDAGGVREVVRRLSTAMAARGHAVHLIARLPGGSDGLPGRDPSTGVPIARVRVVRAPPAPPAPVRSATSCIAFRREPSHFQVPRALRGQAPCRTRRARGGAPPQRPADRRRTGEPGVVAAPPALRAPRDRRLARSRRLRPSRAARAR